MELSYDALGKEEKYILNENQIMYNNIIHIFLYFLHRL